MKLLGNELAPLNIPLHRRLETCGVIFFEFLFFQGASLLAVTTLISLLFTRYYWLTLIYITWYIYDLNTCHRGGRYSHWCRSWRIWTYYCQYFPMRLIKTCELPAEDNYLFAVHPHGIMSLSAFGNFGTEGTGFRKIFPGLTPHLLVLKEQFVGPLMRELLMLTGMAAASVENLQYVLGNKGRWAQKGQVCALIVGGAAESMTSHPGNYKLVLKNRRGFIRTALQTGASLVPVFSFGEVDVFDSLEVSDGSRLQRLQKWFKSMSHFGMPIFWARGIFNYSFGMLPYRRMINTVVGGPIRVEKKLEPTREEIDALHSLYMRELVKLFDEYKGEYCADKEVELEIQ